MITVDATVLSSCFKMLMTWANNCVKRKTATNNYQQTNNQCEHNDVITDQSGNSPPPLVNYRDRFNKAHWLRTTQLELSYFSHFSIKQTTVEMVDKHLQQWKINHTHACTWR